MAHAIMMTRQTRFVNVCCSTMALGKNQQKINLYGAQRSTSWHGSGKTMPLARLGRSPQFIGRAATAGLPPATYKAANSDPINEMAGVNEAARRARRLELSSGRSRTFDARITAVGSGPAASIDCIPTGAAGDRLSRPALAGPAPPIPAFVRADTQPREQQNRLGVAQLVEAPPAARPG
jgi:hypothetical protein